jgi:hypothetical protein
MSAENVSGGSASGRLIDEEALSFLWFQAASLTLHSLGVVQGHVMSDGQRLDSVKRLGQLYLQHAAIMPDEAVLVMDCLLAAAADLVAKTGH